MADIPKGAYFNCGASFSGRLGAHAPLEQGSASLAIAWQALTCAELQSRLTLSYCSAKGIQMSLRGASYPPMPPSAIETPRRLKPKVTQFSHGRSLSVGRVSRPAAGCPGPDFAFAEECEGRPGGRPAHLGSAPRKLSDIGLMPTPPWGLAACARSLRLRLCWRYERQEKLITA